MLALLTVGVLAVTLSGCVYSDVNVEIKDDGFLTMNLTQTFSKEAYAKEQGVSDGALIVADIKKALKEKYPDMKATITEKDADIVASVNLVGKYDETGVVTSIDGEPFPFPINVGVKDEQILFTFDLPLYAQTQGLPDEEQFRNYYSSFNMNVTFPGTVQVTNGEWDKSTNTTSWDIDDAVENLNADTVFKTLADQKQPDYTAAIIFGVGSFLLIAGLLSWGFVFLRKRKTVE